jgi:cytochrome c peroxidase
MCAVRFRTHDDTPVAHATNFFALHHSTAHAELAHCLLWQGLAMNESTSISASATPRSRRVSPHTTAVAIVAALFAGVVAVIATGARTPTTPAAGQLKLDYVRPADVPYPEDNAYTADRELLGRMLFFDPRLSGSSWISCASCHNPGFSWSDALPRAVGHGMQQLGRRTPTIINLAWAPALFWDGRAESLEQQALGPIQAPGEMNLSLEELVRRLDGIEGYRSVFGRAYPGEGISPDTIAKALATFERGVVSAEAPFDRWVAGDDGAISQAAQRGFQLFNEKARCNVCHTGWRFTDDSFYDIGVVSDDRGRGAITPDIEPTHFAFKTPTLRNVVQRAPYLHDGSGATLDDVIELYDRGGLVRRQSLSPEIQPLGLTPEEKSDLVAFLETLTSPDPDTRIPTLPR